VVCREASTEGSGTTKSGTDEQERYMRLWDEDKQAHHCNVHNTISSYSRYRRHWRKEKALTGGGLGIDSVSMRQEVSRGHISQGKRAERTKPISEEDSQNGKGLNIEQLPCCMDPLRRKPPANATGNKKV